MYDKRKNMIRMKRCLAIAIICFLAVVSVFGADGSNVEGVVVYKKPFSEASGIKGVTVVAARVEDGQSLGVVAATGRRTL